MKFRFLGTAAAEGWPAVFCNCPHCLEAARRGGKNIRTRSQALINDDLLLDFPPDTYLHKLQLGLDLSAVRYLLLTHWHMDHFYPQELTIRGGGYSHNMVSQQLHIFCGQDAQDFFMSGVSWELEKSSEHDLIWHILTPFKTEQADGYAITPLPARHMLERPGSTPFFYLIEKEGKSVLYCHDTGWFYDEVWEFLEKRGQPVDLISFDCTGGPLENGPKSGHMGYIDDIRVREKLREIGICGENTCCIVNHFSHNSGMLHEELCETLNPQGFEVSYDGMEIEL
ncbi:MAG: MBL fold metallo-hydrolase [Oscillospiraceae bacterium]|jgi:phosphoribosyl 1,2-cyclic phosphate phosphodiesterase|nr:MBL fold metallo-hydrolase [Oscillospiraceae bacterium]